MSDVPEAKYLVIVKAVEKAIKLDEDAMIHKTVPIYPISASVA